MQEFTFKSAFEPRKSPDPVLAGIDQFHMLCDVRLMPVDVPNDANARDPNPDRKTYRGVRASLLGEDGSQVPFHHKNKGIVVLASSAVKLPGNELRVTIPADYGITDGGHTMEIIRTAKEAGQLLDEPVFVPVTVRVGIPSEWIPEVSGGLNTAMQVKDMSLDNLAGKFEWIKNRLADQPYFGRIAWRENDEGEIDARDVISLMNLFDVQEYDGAKDEHPLISYTSKGAVLSRFERDEMRFKAIEQLLPDILTLHDILRYESKEAWNKNGQGRFGGLGIVESRKRGAYTSLFTGKKSDERLVSGALLPLLAAFRVFVTVEDGEARWTGGFERALAARDANIEAMLKIVHQQFVENGRNPNKLGKAKSVWGQCYQQLRIWQLEQMASKA